MAAPADVTCRACRRRAARTKPPAARALFARASSGRVACHLLPERHMASARRAVIVGTGAGGLTAAAYLAKDGFEVIALDQADRLGGFLAPFSLDGYTFDPGVHYVRQARRGQLLDQLLGRLGIDVERLFVEMDPDGFDAYCFPDFEVRMCRGLERYRDRLIERFPGERDGLTRLFELIAHFGEAA